MLFGGSKRTDATAGGKEGIIGAMTIAWDDAYKRNFIMWKVPRNIRLNDNIVVREDEIAVFYRDGKVLAYLDKPDRYALTSQNAPILGGLIRALSGVKQQAEVYYIQKKVFDGKFGSKQPYQFKDKEFGIVNLRVFGEFRYKVHDPVNFINQFVGTLNYQTSEEVEERIKEQMVLLVYDAIGHLKEKGMGVTELAPNLTNIEQIVLEKSKDHFGMYGIEINKVSGLYINLPEEVQKAVDTRASMQVLGANYLQYQTGQAMREAAQNPSGAAGAGVGIGAGIGAGYAMIGSMAQAAQAAQPQQPQQPSKACVKCGAIIPADAKFCPSCGARQEKIECPNCKASLPADAKFCSNCGAALGSKKCQNCNADIPANSKFCPNCGKSV
ncbi:MAG: SPFH domain-containing protein [Thermoplasmatales archaeon]|nr:SPFH domain-containing protein [Thermoplasmatales archaeon]